MSVTQSCLPIFEFLSKTQSHQLMLYFDFLSDEDEVAKLLVDANADVNSRNNKGATPLIIAAVKGHHSVLRLLANHPTIRLHEQVNLLSLHVSYGEPCVVLFFA